MKLPLTYTIACFMLLLSAHVYADSGNPDTPSPVRRIVISTVDSTLNFHIRIASNNLGGFQKDITYYWEKSGVIHKNQGSFFGNILHGSYVATDSKGRMRTQGEFYNGTKDEEWKSWNADGSIARVEYWKKGKLKQVHHYQNGSVSEQITYSKSRVPQKRIVFSDDKKTERFTFKNGEWVKRGCFLRKKKEPKVEPAPASPPATK